MKRPLLVVAGPTCTGKTRLAVALAELLGPAELLNADSRQVRRGLRVGTCAPTAAELHGVRCRLLDLCEPGERFTAHDWLKQAGAVLAGLDAAGVLGIVVGGTGLYVTALVRGYNLAGAPPDPVRRAAREERASSAGGLAVLAVELRRRDPAGAAAVDLRNPRRVIRALEILDAGEASLDTARRAAPEREATLLGLDVSRPVHEQWVRQRTRRMFDSGALLEEVSRTLAGGLARGALRAAGIGYAEAVDVLDERLDVATAVESTVRRTLRYAKAQRTYFRRETGMRWLDGECVDAAAVIKGLGPEQTFAQRPES